MSSGTFLTGTTLHERQRQRNRGTRGGRGSNSTSQLAVRDSRLPHQRLGAHALSTTSSTDLSTRTREPAGICHKGMLKQVMALEEDEMTQLKRMVLRTRKNLDRSVTQLKQWQDDVNHVKAESMGFMDPDGQYGKMPKTGAEGDHTVGVPSGPSGPAANLQAALAGAGAGAGASGQKALGNGQAALGASANNSASGVLATRGGGVGGGGVLATGGRRGSGSSATGAGQRSFTGIKKVASRRPPLKAPGGTSALRDEFASSAPSQAQLLALRNA